MHQEALVVMALSFMTPSSVENIASSDVPDRLW